MTRTIFIAAALALAVTLPAAPAQAQATRAFVSAAGSDSNNCINTNTPCRHFQNAYIAMPNGGEIDVLDPGNYGALTVNHKLSIVGRGWATVGGVNGAASFVINSGTGDTIDISGVTLDGANIADSSGIQFNSGGSLNVQDSVIRNFAGNGIHVSSSASATQLFVSYTLVADNGGDGIGLFPSGSETTNGVLDHVKMQNNFNGLAIAAVPGQTINVIVSDSVIASNLNDGITIEFDGGVASIMVRNSTIANNTNFGLQMTSGVGGCVGAAGAIIRVSRSAITGNGTGWVNATCSGVLSYGDNNIDGNSNVNSEPPNPLVYH
jgi:hypothetical protein